MINGPCFDTQLGLATGRSSLWRILYSVLRIICLPAQAQKKVFPPNKAQKILKLYDRDLNKQHFKTQDFGRISIISTCFLGLHMKEAVYNFFLKFNEPERNYWRPIRAGLVLR